MEIYTVEQITEADFGCEETSRKEPMALLKLVGDTTKYVEVSEAELEKNGIKEGKKVIIANGKVLKYVRVVAAVIRSKNENGEPIIFATQRGYGEYKDGLHGFGYSVYHHFLDIRPAVSQDHSHYRSEYYADEHRDMRIDLKYFDPNEHHYYQSRESDQRLI